MLVGRSLEYMARRHLETAFLLLTLAAAFVLATPTSLTSSPVVVAQTDDRTAYDVLESFGFPRGLLPDNVVDYTLADDGSFTVNLQNSCKFSVGGHTVRYQTTISGTISEGSLTDLSGASVRVLFIWWTINSITVSGTDLVFRVGAFSATYAASNFDESPECASVSGPHLD